MRRIIPSAALAFIVISSAAHAEGKKLMGAEITAALSDHTLGGTGADGKPWEQIFQKSGVTFYSAGGAQSQGAWAVRGDQYCSQWPPNPSWSCYDFSADGDVYTFTSASGQKTSGKFLN
jgi:hypothetical protein